MTLAAPFRTLLPLSLLHLLRLPGFTLPSHLLGVLTDLAQVPSICPHLHPTPPPPPGFHPISFLVHGPMERPQPTSNPSFNLHVCLPTSPFSEVSLACPVTGQANLKLRRSACLCFLSLGIKGSHYHDQLWSPFNSVLDVHVPIPLL